MLVGPGFAMSFEGTIEERYNAAKITKSGRRPFAVGRAISRSRRRRGWSSSEYPAPRHLERRRPRNIQRRSSEYPAPRGRIARLLGISTRHPAAGPRLVPDGGAATKIVAPSPAGTCGDLGERDGLRVARLMLERPYAPGRDAATIACARTARAVVAPTAWHAAEFRRAGVRSVAVAPEAVDPDLWSPDAAAADSEARRNVSRLLPGPRPAFRVLSVFKWEHRKAPEVLVDAFFAAFGDFDGAELVLRAYRRPSGNLVSTLNIHVATRFHGISTSRPRRCRDSSPRNVHVVAAAIATRLH